MAMEAAGSGAALEPILLPNASGASLFFSPIHPPWANMLDLNERVKITKYKNINKNITRYVLSTLMVHLETAHVCMHTSKCSHTVS